MIVRYVNNAGIEVNLNKFPYRMLISDILDYEWETVETSGRIIGFQKKLTNKEVNVDILKNENSARQNLSKLTDIFEYDVSVMLPGKLFIDEYYLSCFFIKSEKANWETNVLVSCTYEIVTDNPFWIKETLFQYLPQNIQSSGRENLPVITGGDYPGEPVENHAVVREFSFDFRRPSDKKVRYPQFDLPFDFIQKQGKRAMENPSFTDSNFIMTIYGFVDTPSILIAGHPYTIHTIVYEGERIEIDSAAGTVKKIGRMGEETNLYRSRDMTYSVFRKIPPGVQTVIWPGTYGVDILLKDERSEPKWSL